MIMLAPPAGRTGLTLIVEAAACPVDAAADPLAFAVWLACAEPLAFAVSVAFSVCLADLAVDAGEAVFDAAAELLTEAEFVAEVVSGPYVRVCLFLHRPFGDFIAWRACSLPLFELSCRLTSRPSSPISFNDGGHGHADVIDVKRTSVRTISRIGNREIMVTMAE